jgi:hypothetical protein
MNTNDGLVPPIVTELVTGLTNLQAKLSEIEAELSALSKQIEQLTSEHLDHHIKKPIERI